MTEQAGPPLVAVLVVIFTVEAGELRVLLIRRAAEPYRDWWALPGGVLQPDESLDEAASRKLVEETGVRDVYLEQLYTFGDLDGASPRRAVAVTYFALVNHERVRLREGGDWQPAWFDVRRLPDLAFDNARVIRYAVERLRAKLQYTNVAYSLLPEEFTLTELQRAYESILGRRLDKRNFRKRVLSAGIVRATGRTRREGAHRPAMLYAFTVREPMTL